jgi:hypothetical protein
MQKSKQDAEDALVACAIWSYALVTVWNWLEKLGLMANDYVRVMTTFVWSVQRTKTQTSHTETHTYKALAYLYPILALNSICQLFLRDSLLHWHSHWTSSQSGSGLARTFVNIRRVVAGHRASCIHHWTPILMKLYFIPISLPFHSKCLEAWHSSILA